MSSYFNDLTKDEVQDKVREMAEEIPALSDVDLYQRKQDLIDEATEIINADLQPGDGDPLQDGFKDEAEEEAAQETPAEETDGEGQEEETSRRPGQQSSAAFSPDVLHPEV